MFAPLGLTLFVYTTGLVILALSRALLVYLYRDRFAETPNYLWIFPIGVRMDLILLSYVTMIPTALALLAPERIYRKILPFICGWYALAMCFILYMEIATFPFVEEYDVRPDQKFLEYLHHVTEVATTLIKVYALQLTIGFVAIAVVSVTFWRASRTVGSFTRPLSGLTRCLLAPLVLGLIFLGARSTLRRKPANISTAAFSSNHLANEFALNSAYSVVYAAYRLLRHEKNPSLIYGKMDQAEILSRVARRTHLAGEPIEDEIPFLQRQKSPYKYDRPPNVVIFLQESVGAVDVGCLKGPDITPNLCRLRNEGLWFTDLYATGTRTVRGIEATLSGFLPTAARGVVKLGLAKNDFFTAASIFKAHGYATEFMYGGMSNFDEMRGFLLGNDFETIYDQPTFENPAFVGTWGVSDEDLVRKANEVFRNHGEKPFFSLLLSTSNHLPYEFPDGRIELFEQPKQTHFNAIKYADYAIGLLIELAKKEKYFENTIFLIVADHNSHVRGNDFVPISKFHIPGLMIGPNIPQREINLLSSQIDLLPTLLHFSGLEAVHPLVGRNLMTLPPNTPGRAFMQFGENNAYQIEKDVIVLRPYLKPEQFTYEKEALVPAPLNDEMVRDALAHAHFPWVVYSEKKYRVPTKYSGLATLPQHSWPGAR
jgi:phosphoglycerol transferase MdoB-like AlkP superfamily enzyme